MNAADILQLVLVALWLVLGAYYFIASAQLASKPRRGTGLKLSRRGYQGMGLLFVILAVGQVAALATG